VSPVDHSPPGPVTVVAADAAVVATRSNVRASSDARLSRRSVNRVNSSPLSTVAGGYRSGYQIVVQCNGDY
jgi:hypothetical protein